MPREKFILTIWVSGVALPFILGTDAARIKPILARHNVFDFDIYHKEVIHLMEHSWTPIRFKLPPYPFPHELTSFITDLGSGLWPQIMSRHPPVQAWLRSACRAHFLGMNGKMIQRLDQQFGVVWKMNNQYNPVFPHGYIPITLLECDGKKRGNLGNLLRDATAVLRSKRWPWTWHDGEPAHECLLLRQPGKHGKRAHPPSFPPPRSVTEGEISPDVSATLVNTDSGPSDEDEADEDNSDAGSLTPRLTPRDANGVPLSPLPPASPILLPRPTSTSYINCPLVTPVCNGPPTNISLMDVSPGFQLPEGFPPSPRIETAAIVPRSPTFQPSPRLSRRLTIATPPPSPHLTYAPILPLRYGQGEPSPMMRPRSTSFAGGPSGEMSTPIVHMGPSAAFALEVQYLRDQISQEKWEKNNLWLELGAQRDEIARLKREKEQCRCWKQHEVN